MYVYVHTLSHAYMLTCISKCMVYVHVCVCMYIYIYVHVCMRVCVCQCVRVCVCMFVCLRVRLCACACVRMFTRVMYACIFVCLTYACVSNRYIPVYVTQMQCYKLNYCFHACNIDELHFVAL